MLSGLTSKEYAEWKAYYALNPFGEKRKDMRMARLCFIMASAWRGKNSPSITEDEFMFNFDGKHEMTEEEIKARLGFYGDNQ